MTTKAPTKAPVPKPARPGPPRMSFLGAAPAPTAAADNMQAVKLQDMSFKVDPTFHRRFKSTASMNGLSMKDLLEQSFKLWEEANGQGQK